MNIMGAINVKSHYRRHTVQTVLHVGPVSAAVSHTILEENITHSKLTPEER